MSAVETRSVVDLAHAPRFALGALEVRPSTGELLADGRSQVLEPRIMQVLVALARRRGEVVSRDDLNAWCWSGRAVGGDAINRCILAIRRLARAHGGFAVTTVARVGYRLDAAGSPCAGQAQAPDAPTVGVPPLPPSKPSIAVLPFTNLSGDPEQDYFADGMVEEMARALSRFKSIFVIGGGSGLPFKGKTTTPQEAGRILGVGYVLAGSIRQAAGRVRIAVKLVDASNGAQIWADRFDDTLEGIFALQDRVALRVAGVIEPTLQTLETRRAVLRPTDNIGSYDLWLRAHALSSTHGKTEVFEALALLERALALDPRFALALSNAAWCHSFILINNWSDDLTGHRREGVALAHRSLRLGGDDPDVLANTAVALWQLGEGLKPSLALIDRAIELNPGSSNTWYLSGVLRMAAGEPEIVVEHIGLSVRLDPWSPNNSSRSFPLGAARFLQGRFEEAVAHLTEAAQSFGLVFVFAFLAATFGHLGRASEAREALARYRTLSHTPISAVAAMFPKPAHRELFLDGIALAEGNG